MIKCLPIAFIFCTHNGQSQTTTDRYEYRSLAGDIGVDNMFVNAHHFNQWAKLSGQKPPAASVSGHLAFSYIAHYFDGGIEVIFPDPYRIEGMFAGVRLTRYKNKVTSWLNIHTGYFSALYNNLHPVNYTLTQEQMGKQMQLQYNNWYVGISNKTYWTHHHKKHETTLIGINLLVGYTTGRGNWSYGYYIGSGKTLSFVSQPVNGIPSIGDVFLNIGLLCGIGSR
jgi:hypothetical protein